MSPNNNRILIIDDNAAIHEDFRKIFGSRSSRAIALDNVEALLRGESIPAAKPVAPLFEIDSAFQGEEGLRMAEAARADRRPYALAFVDVRMPPGWDGVETVERLWATCPDLQVVICTAYSDYSWVEIAERLKQPDSLVILKKPFDAIEVLQMAHALTRKWLVTQQATLTLDALENTVRLRTEAYETANRSLREEIAERARAQTALRLSEERFEKAFRANPMSISIRRDADDHYVDVNGAFLALTGYTYAETLEKSPEDLSLYHDPIQLFAFRKTMREGSSIRNFPCLIRRKSGEIRDVRISAECFTYCDAPHWLVLTEDVTEKQALEDRLRQAQKMEAVGQLAAGVAHDFNNLLTVIQAHAQMQLAAANLDQHVAESFRQVAGASDRAANLTRQLLAFSRKQVMRFEPLDLNAGIVSLGKLLRCLVGERVELQFELDNALPAVVADKCSIEQILLNLAVNARDAIAPHHGRIAVRTRRATVVAAEASRNPEARPGEFAVLTVLDTGCGMLEAVRAKIFEPFFTTKEIGKGTGMGLATVHGLVKQHQGWIEVQSAVGKGSAFEIFLPIANGRATIAPPADQRPANPEKFRATVLVVEDEPELRKLVSRVLDGSGCNVIQAENASEALRLWREYGTKVDLLFTDMLMPGGMSGGELAAQLREARPGLKVVFTSGYSPELYSADIERVLGKEVTLQAGRNYLPKPFVPATLISTVAHALAE